MFLQAIIAAIVGCIAYMTFYWQKFKNFFKKIFIKSNNKIKLSFFKSLKGFLTILKFQKIMIRKNPYIFILRDLIIEIILLRL